jgi:hypothetical protein
LNAGDVFEHHTVTDCSGSTGEITLTNNSNSAWDGWTVEFEWDHQITQVWNGTLAPATGDQYTIRNAGWNSSVSPGTNCNFWIKRYAWRRDGSSAQRDDQWQSGWQRHSRSGDGGTQRWLRTPVTDHKTSGQTSLEENRRID